MWSFGVQLPRQLEIDCVSIFAVRTSGFVLWSEHFPLSLKDEIVPEVAVTATVDAAGVVILLVDDFRIYRRARQTVVECVETG